MRLHHQEHPDYYHVEQRRARAERREERRASFMSPEERRAKAAVHQRQRRLADPQREREIDEGYRRRLKDDPERLARIRAQKAEYNRRYWSTHSHKALTPEQREARRRRYYQITKERDRDKKKAWREAHSVEAAEKARLWREANPERFKAARDRWRQENWQKVLESNGRRRAAMRTPEIERVDRMAIFKRDQGLCYLCGGPVKPDARRTDPESLSVDHVIPLSKGGSHSEANLRVTHIRCNLRKGVRLAPAVARG